MKKEAVSHSVWEDLANRNDNWDKLDGVPEKVGALETNKQETQFKISSVEKELNSLKSVNINSNQEATQVAQGYGVVSLPKTAGEGHANFGIKGLTATNLVENGDFRNGISLWSRVGDFTPTTLNNIYSFTVTAQNGRMQQKLSPTVADIGDKMYRRAIVKSNSNLVSLGDAGAVLENHSGSGSFEVLSHVRSEMYTNKYVSIIDRRESGFSEIQVKYVLAINLTQTFGAGNEPTKEECDAIFSNYFEGTKSTISASRLKSVSEDETQESIMYLPNVGELRSLPNGVADEIVNGELVQRVSDEYILQSLDIRAIQFGEHVDLAYTILFNDRKEGTPGFVNVYNMQEAPNVGYDNVEHTGKFFTNVSAKMIYFILEKGTTLTQAREQLTGTELTYQLAEPIITPINVSVNLISYPSGTVYIEQVVADAGLYTTKMDILNTDLPIKTLDKLSKVDYTTGLEHSLDVSKAVVTAQSFTHPDLVENDIVFFEYYYDLESTNGNASVEYYDSRYTVKDSVTDKVYKWSITIANGVPTITTVEV